MGSLDIRSAEIISTSNASVRLLDALLDYCQDCGSDLYCERCDAYWVNDQPCDCECQTCGEARTEETCSRCGGEEFSNADAMLARAKRARGVKA